MTDELEKELPNSEESEQVCLGSIILDNSAMDTCVKFFGPEDLYNPWHRTIYKAMVTLYSNKQKIDPILILEEVKKGNPIGPELSVTQLVNLTMGVPHILNIEEYAKQIRTHSLSRQAIKLAGVVRRDLLAGDVDPAEVLGKLEQRAMALSTKLNIERNDGPNGFVRVVDLASTVEAQFHSYHKGESTGVLTGFYELDSILDGGGLQKKGSYVIGGREKSGKTSLALDMCEHITTKQHKGSLIVTLEMSKETMFKRLYSKYTGIPYYMFRPGFYDTNLDNPYTRAVEGLKEFAQFPFFIADNLFTMDEIYRHCAKLIELGYKEGQVEVGVIVLDYLQLIGIADTRVPTVERVTRVSRDIKRLASDLDVPVIVMSNLNRTRLSEEGQEPDTDNLRESGSIAFDAEAIMFVHNPSYIPGKPYEQKDITDYLLILSRQRNGPTGRFNMKLIGPYMQFMSETDYNKSHGVDTLPPSQGQQHKKAKSLEDLWDDEDDDERN
jgi:replicative DNA helicase